MVYPISPHFTLVLLNLCSGHRTHLSLQHPNQPQNRPQQREHHHLIQPIAIHNSTGSRITSHQSFNPLPKRSYTAQRTRCRTQPPQHGYLITMDPPVDKIVASHHQHDLTIPMSSRISIVWVCHRVYIQTITTTTQRSTMSHTPFPSSARTTRPHHHNNNNHSILLWIGLIGS